MFYFNLENQIHFLIVIIFSSYIYFSAFALKMPLTFIKYFGSAFFTPLILGIMSFLSLNAEFSSSYLFFAEFLLVTSLLFILLAEKSSDFSLIIFILLYALPLGVVILNLNFDSFSRSSVFDLILSVYFGIITIVVISCLFLRRYSRIFLYTGLFLVTASLLVVQISRAEGINILSLLLKFSGYILFSIFFYRSTFFQLEKDYEKNTLLLNRINQSLQQEVSRRVEEIERSNRKLAEKNKLDELTGVYNKKAITDRIEEMIENQPNREFSVVMMDVDNFKRINDSYGHITGDKCLKSLVSITKNTIRGDDMLGRFGGDEFIIVMNDSNIVKAYLAAERLRKRIEMTNEPHFTVSIGIASYPADADNTKRLIAAADEILYVSKKNGRNRVSYSGQEAK